MHGPKIEKKNHRMQRNISLDIQKIQAEESDETCV